MNTKLTARSICVVAIGGWAALASALSLGPVTGSAVIGRPLELIAPIGFDELAQGNGSGCVTGEVRYGDRVVDRTRVEVDLSADAARQWSFARISSAVPVDEPFVTVVLNAGCGHPSSRRYVLLAEAPGSEPMALVAASKLGAVPVAPVPQPRSPARMAAAKASASTMAGAGPRADRLPPVRRVAAVARELAPPSRGRLQLAVWDPGSEQLPWLRASTELQSSPTADAARRAAATSLWRALNAQPQDLLRTAERLRGLEGEVNSLRSLSARHRAEIASARESLQSAQGQRHSSLLLVTLLALLAGSGAAFFWHRLRRPAQAGTADSWYGPLEPRGDVNVVVDEEQQAAVGAPVTTKAQASVAAQPAPVEVVEDPAPVKRAKPAMPAQPFEPAGKPPILAPLSFTPADMPPPVQPVQGSAQAGLKVDALNGAQQQSEFFASLGQVDEAVAVLTSYLEESRERPVLAFLELFRIYHGTGMRQQFEELQSTFRQTFAMDVPSFSQYKDDLRELDLFLLPVTRIASAWPSEHSLEIIEELLFKRPANARELLSLEAYRELMWLYALGQEVVHNTGSPAGLQLLGDRGLSNDHFILPWAMSTQQEPTELSLDRLDTIDVAAELSAFGVDIDLTAIRGDGQPATNAKHVPQPGPTPAPAPAAAADADFDAFDAAMRTENRRR